jgi:PEP-CTERM motif
MTKRAAYLSAIAILSLGAVSTPGAQAAFVATISEVGTNVVESGAGTLDLTDLFASPVSKSNIAAMKPSSGELVAGPELVDVDFFSGDETGPSFFMGPDSFGPGGLTFADQTSGDAVFISPGALYVPHGYKFGAALDDTSTYFNKTLDSMGLTPGMYVYSWGSGAHADTFTTDIVVGRPPPAPEPSTWAMMLIGFAGLGCAVARRKGARHPVSP